MVRHRPAQPKRLWQRLLNGEQADQRGAHRCRRAPGEGRSKRSLRAPHRGEGGREHQEQDQGERRHSEPAEQAADRLGQQVHERAGEVHVEHRIERASQALVDGEVRDLERHDQRGRQRHGRGNHLSQAACAQWGREREEHKHRRDLERRRCQPIPGEPRKPARQIPKQRKQHERHDQDHGGSRPGSGRLRDHGANGFSHRLGLPAGRICRRTVRRGGVPRARRRARRSAATAPIRSGGVRRSWH